MTSTADPKIDQGKARLSARERILAVANDLFYKEGVHTVGIDRIIEEAGVAKASLYNSFGSKDDLVRAYLDRRRDRVMSRVLSKVEAQTDPRERLLAVFDAQAELIAEPGFNGCAFSSATSEAHSEAVDAATIDYRKWFRDLFTELAAAAGVGDPALIGQQMQLLYDGAGHSARMDGDRKAAASARLAAAQLLDLAVSPPKSSRSPRRSRTAHR